jgi:basic membrane protein A
VRVRMYMPLVAAALIAVLVMAVGAGTGAAKSDVQAAPAKYKVTLVTDIGGLDDRSFNFLANKGLKLAQKQLGIEGSVFISKSDRDYIPNLTRAARNGSGLVIGVGFLMAEQVAQVAARFPATKFAIIDNSGVAKEFKKAKPTNVRGILFKEQEAGYLVGFLAGKQIISKPYNGQTKIGAVGGLKIPPVDRFIAGYYAGAKRAGAQVQVTHNYSQDFVDQAKCKEQALGMIADGAGVVFQVAGQCGLGVLSAAKEKGVFGIGARDDERHEEGRRRGLPDDRGREEDAREVPHELQRDLHGRQRRRRIREDLFPDRAQPEGAGRGRPQAPRGRQDQEHPAGPARNDGLGRGTLGGRGGVSIPPLPVSQLR